MMSSQQSADVFETASNLWEAALDKKDYDAAIGIGIDAYLHYRGIGNERLSRGALNLVYVAIGELSGLCNKPGSSASCSFCGRNGSEVQLGAGPNAYICTDCVEIFHKTLKPKS